MDSVTLPPVLIAPKAEPSVGEAFAVEYSLPETPAPGTVTLTIAPEAGEEGVIGLPVSTQGVHTVTIDPYELARGGSLLSGPEVLKAGRYALRIGYQGSLLNPSAESGAMPFKFAHPTEAPTLFSPAGGSRSPATLHVHYDLPEAAAPGSLKLLFQGATPLKWCSPPPSAQAANMNSRSTCTTCWRRWLPSQARQNPRFLTAPMR